MSVEATSWVWNHSPYKGTEKLIHLALADSANDMNHFDIWARQSWIAEKVSCDRTTVNKCLQRAVEDGFLALLEDNATAGRPNRYRFLMPDIPVRWTGKKGVENSDTPGHQRPGGCGEIQHPVLQDSTGGVVKFNTETEVKTEDRRNQPLLPQHRNAGGEEYGTTTTTTGTIQEHPDTSVTGGSAPLSHPSPIVTPTEDDIPTDNGPEGNSTGRQAKGEGPRLPEYVALCELLADLIAEHGVKRPNPDQKKWYDAVRLLVEKDGYTVAQVETMIRWAQADDFWCSNILSTPKLRTQFTQLRMKRNQDIEKRKGGGPASSDHDRIAAYRKELAEKNS